MGKSPTAWPSWMPEETNSGHESRIRPGHVGSGPAGSPAGFCAVCVFLSVLSFCQVGQAISRSARNRSGRSIRVASNAKPGVIAAALKKSFGSVWQALLRLQEKGKVTRMKDKRWALRA